MSRVQIQDEALYISLLSDAPGKGMNQSLSTSAMGK